MQRRRLLWLLIPLTLVVLLVGTFLMRLPLAAQRLGRSACFHLGIEKVHNATDPLSISFARLDGAPYPISDLGGRLVLLNFWLTTCDPCLEELPALLDLAMRLGQKGMALLLVSTDKDGKDIQAFIDKVPRLKALPPNVVILHDPAGQVARSLGTRKYPETYLIHPDGRWGGRVVGARHWTDRAVVDCLTTRLP